MGSNPTLPAPTSTLIPTINIATATGWPTGAKPESAPDTVVTAFANGLDHPRWLYVLPNGDVLVAETNAPSRPEEGRGIKGWFMRRAQKNAGAGVPSANRITLLRDANGDGVEETRSVFLKDLNSPFGMALIGRVRPTPDRSPTRAVARLLRIAHRRDVERAADQGHSCLWPARSRSN